MEKGEILKAMEVIKVDPNFVHSWADGDEEFKMIEYKASSERREHTIQIGYTLRNAYGEERARVIVFIDKYPYTEFVGADDFEKTGDVLSEIKVADENDRMIMCRYPEDRIPSRYSMFQVEGLPLRIKAKGVHNAWAVVVNLSDHRTMIALAALRKTERYSMN